jgi:APA family basic amino acid/polyamine antiporter
MSDVPAPVPGAEQPTVFSRSASGLVRDLSLWDAMWFGILSSGLFFSFVFFFPYPQFASPGINTGVMLVIAAIASIPICIAYAALGSAMPRAGGDYLFQSRAIAPEVGFTVPFGWAILLWTIFFPLTAFVFVSYGIVPILTAFGRDVGGAGWIGDFTTWLGGSTGKLVATLVLSALAWLLCVAGVRIYRGVQRWVFVPAVVLTSITLLVLFLTTSTSSFEESFNSFPANVDAGITYDGVIETARKNGWAAPSFSFGDTILWVAIMMGVVPFAVFAAEGILGEVKGARNFRRLSGAFVTGALFIGVWVMALTYFLFERTASRDFLSAASYTFNGGSIEFPYGVDVSNFSAIINDNTLVVIAVAVGFMASAFQLMVGIFMNVSRVLVSMGLDRSLPARFGSVHPRFHTPVFAATTYLALITVTSIFFNYNEDWFTPLTYAAAISGEGILLFGCLAALLLPWRAPAVYAASPVSRYSVGPIPLIQLAGGVGLAILAVSWVVIMTNDKLGITGAGLGLKFDPRLTVIVPVIVGLAIFYAWRLVERSRGVDPSLAFKAVTPE